MSALLFYDDIIFYQRLLKSAGLYTGSIDGVWGAKTGTSDIAFENASLNVAREFGTFDTRSERNILTLQIPAQRAARKSLRRLLDKDIGAKIISGTRSYSQQNELFRKGRFGNPGPKVTNARGGSSNHNFGVAWDIGLFRRGEYLSDAQSYETVAESALSDELEWGGNWVSFKDLPHYQLKTTLSISEIRRRFEGGQTYLQTDA